MTRKVARKSTKPDKDPALIVRTYALVKEQYDNLTKLFETAKKDVKTLVDSEGYSDDKGHKWIEFDEPVAGVARVKHERRVSVSLDHDLASKTLKKKDLLDRCSETLVVLPGHWSESEIEGLLQGVEEEFKPKGVEHRLIEDEIYACVYDEDADLSQADIDDMTKTRVSWALKIETA